MRVSHLSLQPQAEFWLGLGEPISNMRVLYLSPKAFYFGGGPYNKDKRSLCWAGSGCVSLLLGEHGRFLTPQKGHGKGTFERQPSVYVRRSSHMAASIIEDKTKVS